MRFRHSMKRYTADTPAAPPTDTSGYTSAICFRGPTPTLLPGGSKITTTFSVHSSQSRNKTATLYAPRKRSYATHPNIHRSTSGSPVPDSYTSPQKCSLHRCWIRNTAAFGGGGNFFGPHHESVRPSRLLELVAASWSEAALFDMRGTV